VTEPAPPPGEESGAGEEELVHGEVLDVLPIRADVLPVRVDVRPLEPARPPAGVALVQTAAVAATGFVAGVATAAVLGRRRQRRLGRPAPARPAGTLEVVSSRTYLVDVHVLERRG
jgi:hypothetical protein